MDMKDVLTNEFVVRSDESTEKLNFYGAGTEEAQPFPIELRLETLLDMGLEDASKWVGKTILLLVSTMREKLFRLKD